MILHHQDYESASEAFFEGFKLDPENVEIEHALRYLSTAFHLHVNSHIILIN
jgi:hypothetical protein